MAEDLTWFRLALVEAYKQVVLRYPHPMDQVLLQDIRKFLGMDSANFERRLYELIRMGVGSKPTTVNSAKVPRLYFIQGRNPSLAIGPDRLLSLRLLEP